MIISQIKFNPFFACIWVAPLSSTGHATGKGPFSCGLISHGGATPMQAKHGSNLIYVTWKKSEPTMVVDPGDWYTSYAFKMSYCHTKRLQSGSFHLLHRIVKTDSMVCQCPSLPTEGYTIDKHWKALPRIVPSLLRSLKIALRCPPMQAILAYWIWSFSLLPLGAMAAIHRLRHRVAARAMTTSECACILGIAHRSRL